MTCPKCGGKIIEYENVYACENRKVKWKYNRYVNVGNCDFFIFKKIQFKNVEIELSRQDVENLLRFNIVVAHARSLQKDRDYLQKLLLKEQDNGEYKVELIVR